ncbi:MAG: hypothetical protein RIR12_1248 [Bacteroidota bacterium]|jgi:hypothetical protein
MKIFILSLLSLFGSFRAKNITREYYYAYELCWVGGVTQHHWSLSLKSDKTYTLSHYWGAKKLDLICQLIGF